MVIKLRFEVSAPYPRLLFHGKMSWILFIDNPPGDLPPSDNISHNTFCYKCQVFQNA